MDPFSLSKLVILVLDKYGPSILIYQTPQSLLRQFVS